MALHYLIDGYNVIKKIDFLNYKKLKDAREALLRFIDRNTPQGSPNNKVTIVFDGKDDVFSFSHNYDFNVIFTKNESADTCIKSLVDKASNPKNFIIVSDDRDIILHCRAQGAKILAVVDFIKKGYKKNMSLRTQDKEFSELSIVEQRKINEELAKLWLK